jgi:hypothetical protein
MLFIVHCNKYLTKMYEHNKIMVEIKSAVKVLTFIFTTLGPIL